MPSAEARVVMSNQLVAASYRMVIGEKRVIMLALAQIGPEDEPTDDDMYIISINDYILATGLDRQVAWLELVDAADRLISKIVRIDIGSSSKWEKISFVQQSRYDPNIGISIRFSKPILPFISQLKRDFTQYRLSDAIAFRSVNTIRIYELLMRFQSTGVCEISVDDLRKQLDISAEYKNGGDFRRFVVERAVDEINKFGRWVVSFTPKKSGRKIDRFLFSFHRTADDPAAPKKSQTKKPAKIPRRFIEVNGHLTPPGASWDEVYAKPPAALRAAWEACDDWVTYLN